MEAPEHFDTVIVGSGFGGAVMAYRLSEAGKSVCILERGRSYPPGSFPRSPLRMRSNFWDPSQGLYGLYNPWSFSGLGALVASGLGGGSLIYANVLIRKDERWFVREDIEHGGFEYWPVTRSDLDPHYDRVERMLKAERYPYADTTAKTRAFRYAAEKANLNWYLPNLAVAFSNPGSPPTPGEPILEQHPNLHGRTRYTCRLCGECNVGCNYGSKNTLDFTYLTEARRLGAEIRPLSEVRTFGPRDGGGYLVHYVRHDLSQEGTPIDTHDPSVRPPITISADRLVLSAGTLGSTFLLLRNRSSFPRMSDRLGSRFSGNGDLLTFALKCGDSTSGRRVPRRIEASFGTVITSTIRFPDEVEGGDGRGLYLQDAGYPGFVDWVLQVFDEPGNLPAWRRLARGLFWRWLSESGPGSSAWGWRWALWQLLRRWMGNAPETDVGALISSLIGDSELSGDVLPLLAMGRDVPDGSLRLDAGRLNVDWRIGRSGPYFERARRAMEGIARALEADFVDNPIWNISRVITVHGLGGCPMGRNEHEGVVDSYGRVFNYPGLYVADGAVMPGPVGPNPSLTIAALSDRFADGILGH